MDRLKMNRNCPLLTERSKPAYPGARFDADGYCVNHPKMQLCKLTDDGKFKIVRKTCQRCGTAGLINSRTVKTNVHGYEAKPVKHREQIQGLLTAGGGLFPSNKRTAATSHRVKSNSSRDLKPNRDIGPKSQSARGIDSRGERSAKPMLQQSKSFSGNVSRDDSDANGNASVSSKGRAFAGGSGNDGQKTPRCVSPARRLDGSRRGGTVSPVQMAVDVKTAPSYLRKVSEEGRKKKVVMKYTKMIKRTKVHPM